MFTDSSDPGDLGDGSPGVSTSHRCFKATRPVMKVISVRISQSIWNHIWSSGKKGGFFPDGIYTGFLSDDKQADRILKFMDAFAGKDTLILTDPVMGE